MKSRDRVHELALRAPVVAMTMNLEPDRPADCGGDPEWVADLFETLREGDLDVALAGLESLVRAMRKAAKARRVLATVEPSLIREGLEVRATRRGTRL